MVQAPEASGALDLSQLSRHFWTRWTGHTLLVVPFAWFVAFIAGTIVHGLFGFGDTDRGTPVSNIFVYMAFGAVFGALVGTVQWRLLRRLLPISRGWILACVAGFVVGEGLVGLAWGLSSLVMVNFALVLVGGAVLGVISALFLDRLLRARARPAEG